MKISNGYSGVGGVLLMAGALNAVGQESAPLFKAGPVDIRPYLSYRVEYNDNLFAENKRVAAAPPAGTSAGRDRDWSHVFTPGVRLAAGDVEKKQAGYFGGNYEAVITKFQKYNFSDSVDHNAGVMFGGNLNKLSLKVAQDLQSRSDADVAGLGTDGRVKRKSWITRAGAGYEVSDKTTFGLDLAQDLNDYDRAGFFDTRQWSAMAWLDHQVSSKVKLGVGGGAGYLQVDDSTTTQNPNSVYQQGRVRATWEATAKLDVSASAGIENRHFQAVTGDDRVSFVFDVGANWKFSDRTSLTLVAGKSSEASPTQLQQIVDKTSVIARVAHNVWEGLTANLDAGYSFSKYNAVVTAAAAATNRKDHNVFLKPNLSYRFMERATASVYYSFTKNNSNQALDGFDFDNNKFGLELSYRF